VAMIIQHSDGVCPPREAPHQRFTVVEFSGWLFPLSFLLRRVSPSGLWEQSSEPVRAYTRVPMLCGHS
jgi:hypothetical protein